MSESPSVGEVRGSPGGRGRRRVGAWVGAAAALGLAGLWAEALRVGRADDRAAGAGIGLAALLFVGGLVRASRPRAASASSVRARGRRHDAEAAAPLVRL